MALAHSKVTAQGQVSGPAEVRRLGVGPGSVLAAALERFKARPAVGFSDCLLVEIARKAGHGPLGTFDRGLGKFDGAQPL